MFFVLDAVKSKVDVSDWQHNIYEILDTEMEDLERLYGVTLYKLTKAGIEIHGFELSANGGVVVTLQTMQDIIESQLLIYKLQYKDALEFQLIRFENMSQTYRNKGKFVIWLKKTFPCLKPLYKRKGSMGFYGLLISTQLERVEYINVPWGCLGISFLGSHNDAVCTIGTVILPNTIFDMVLSWKNFSGIRQVDTLVFPNKMTFFAQSAFYGAYVKHIVLPKSLSVIGEGCFVSSKLVSIELPSSLTQVGQSAFSRCNCLTEVVIHGDADTPTLELSSTFSNCRDLTSVVSTRSLNLYRTFYQDASLEQVVFKDNSCVQKLGDSTFLGCIKLHTLQLGNSYTEIASSCFDHCISLESFDFAPTLKRIGYEAFAYCSALTHIDLSKTQVNTVEDGAFRNCFSVQMLQLSPMCSVIGRNAFSRMDLSRLDVPPEISSIDAFAFAYNSGLSVVTYKGSFNIKVQPTAFLGCNLVKAMSTEDGIIYGSLLRQRQGSFEFDSLVAFLKGWSGYRDEQGFPLIYFDDLFIYDSESVVAPTIEQKELVLQFIFKYVECVEWHINWGDSGKQGFFKDVPSASHITKYWFKSSGSSFSPRRMLAEK